MERSSPASRLCPVTTAPPPSSPARSTLVALQLQQPPALRRRQQQRRLHSAVLIWQLLVLLRGPACSRRARLAVTRTASGETSSARTLTVKRRGPGGVASKFWTVFSFESVLEQLREEHRMPACVCVWADKMGGRASCGACMVGGGGGLTWHLMHLHAC